MKLFEEPAVYQRESAQWYASRPLSYFNNQQVKTNGEGNRGSEIIHGSPYDETDKNHRNPLSKHKN